LFCKIFFHTNRITHSSVDVKLGEIKWQY
jgi:hypothetical protein